MMVVSWEGLLWLPCYNIASIRQESSPGAALSYSPPRPVSSFPLVCRHVTPFREDLVNSAKLYVGNLSYETSQASLRTVFERHGEVASVTLITDRDSGRPKGFGFVEMGTPEQAQAAKGALDGKQLDGRALKIDMAKEQVPRAPHSGGGYGGGGYGGGGGGGGGNRRW